MKRVATQTYRAEICIGTREGYDGPVHHMGEVHAIVQEYVDRISLGVEVIEGTCIYTGGNEPCARVCLINYPRFPKSREEVYDLAVDLGKILASRLRQIRFTVVATDVTEMFESDSWTT